jgi:hypothetical protein
VDRILKDTPATATVAFYGDGAIVDPGVVTVTISREDGTVLVAAGATGGAGATARTRALPTSLTASLDVLTLTWQSANAGSLTTYVEVVGGFLFTEADARALKPLDNATTYPNADLLKARALAEAAIEDACRVAFVPRYAREKVDGTGTVDLLLPTPRPLTVVAASIDGTAIIPGDVELYRDGRLYYRQGWTEGRKNVEVKWTHGYAVPPPRVGRAALLIAKRVLVDSAVSDRATSVVTDEGTQFLVTAGVRQAVFDIPEANAVVDEYGYPRVL